MHDKDPLGTRMKENYEDRTRYLLPRRTYSILRLDGKSFHTFTKHCSRPFDRNLTHALNIAAIKLVEQIDGAQFAYLQSDEISVLLTDFTTKNTEAWFKGNIQKICSVSASILSAEFNAVYTYHPTRKLGYFDSRVFSIPDPVEVANYFIWRQKDCTRNSINSVAQSLYSHKELKGKSCNDLQEMVFQKGTNWNDLETSLKRGRVIKKEKYINYMGEIKPYIGNTGSIVHKWAVDNDIPIFTQSDYLEKLIPERGY
jgi:tRNA(His) guanylyltransferase